MPASYSIVGARQKKTDIAVWRTYLGMSPGGAKRPHTCVTQCLITHILSHSFNRNVSFPIDLVFKLEIPIIRKLTRITSTDFPPLQILQMEQEVREIAQRAWRLENVAISKANAIKTAIEASEAKTVFESTNTDEAREKYHKAKTDAINAKFSLAAALLEAAQYITDATLVGISDDELDAESLIVLGFYIEDIRRNGSK